MMKTLAALLTVLSGVQIAAAEVETVKRWDFSRPDDLKGWRIGHVLTDLRVRDGHLTCRLTGSDAFLFAPAVNLPLDGTEIRVRWRCNRTGSCQVYWGTDAEPAFTERRQVSRAANEADVWTEQAFPLGGPAADDRRLVALRLDPFNGNTDGHVEIDWVTIVRTEPVLEVSFGTDRAVVRPGEAVSAQVFARQTEGRRVRDGLTAQLVGTEAARKVRVEVSLDKAAKPTALPLTPGKQGVHAARVSVAGADGTTTHELAATFCVNDAAPPVSAELIRGRQVAIEPLAVVAGNEYGAAQLWLIDEEGKASRRVGLLSPLAELAFRSKDGRVVSRHPRFWVAGRTANGLKLSAEERDGDALWKTEVTFRLDGNEPEIAIVSTLRGPDGGALLKFAGPTLLTGLDAKDPLDRYAIFGGLEYLEPGWKSSSARAVGERYADRWAPHPFEVTLPVMAVEQDGVTVGMLWDPTRPWDGEHTVPTATFASPNFVHRQANHMAQLSVPTIPDWVDANAAMARRCYTTAADQPVRIACMLRVAQNESVTWMGKHWYETYGTPEPPPAPHDEKKTYDIMAQNYGQTTYWENEKGWRRHWFLDKSSRFAGDVAAELLAHAAATGETKWVERTGITGREIIDVLGPLAARVEHAGAADGAIGSMRPDGTWAFHNTPSMIERTKKHSQGKYETLGEDGSTSLGTCVQRALPMVRYAHLTGKEKYVAATRKALDAMMRFRVPRGAQVWEVAQGVPDIRAAALAVQAYRMGYEITGDRKYLDEATYWGYAGLPFLYSWRVPHNQRPSMVHTGRNRDDSHRGQLPTAELFEEPVREITPYACIPVLGTTFYIHSWFGNVVQWCGLEWAEHVIELTHTTDDKLLRAVADGVLRSGLQQTFDREPWVGLYPDAWHLAQNMGAGALISARLLLNCLKAQGTASRWASTWTRVVDMDGRRIHVNGWGDVKVCEIRNGALHVEASFLPETRSELVITNAPKPKTVAVDGKTLPEGRQIGQWHYVTGLPATIVSFTQPDGDSDVMIRW